MKTLQFCVRMLAGLSACMVWPGVCVAQWSNPLLTEGVGSGRDLSAYYYRGGAEPPGSRRPPPRGDKNPAETLLREMNGTNYRQYTGQAYFSGRPVKEARRMIARQMARDRRAQQRTASRQAADSRTGRNTRPANRSSRTRPRHLPPPSGPVY
ncbi:MAG TPA: hypothetical protein VF306_06000 [Pirellulales bacterium]